MKLKHFVVCDDIRTEVGNKHSLMGIFDEEVILTGPTIGTAPWPRLLHVAVHLRLAFEKGDKTPTMASVAITMDGSQLAEAKGPLSIEHPNRSINLALIFNTLPIPHPGMLEIRAKLNAGESAVFEHLENLNVRGD